jgi:hypothetical protein
VPADERHNLEAQGLAEPEFFLRLYGLREGASDIPPPPKPAFDINDFEHLNPKNPGQSGPESYFRA